MPPKSTPNYTTTGNLLNYNKNTGKLSILPGWLVVQALTQETRSFSENGFAPMFGFPEHASFPRPCHVQNLPFTRMRYVQGEAKALPMRYSVTFCLKTCAYCDSTPQAFAMQVYRLPYYASMFSPNPGVRALHRSYLSLWFNLDVWPLCLRHPLSPSLFSSAAMLSQVSCRGFRPQWCPSFCEA